MCSSDLDYGETSAAYSAVAELENQIKSLKWVISDSPEYQINIDNTRGIGINNEAKKIAVLYEPQSILPGNYAEVLRNQNSYYKIFTHRKSLCDNDKILHMPPFFPSWISESESIIYQKNKLVSMIASDKVMCDGHLYRQKIAGKFPYKHDLFGRGRNFSSTEQPSSNHDLFRSRHDLRGHLRRHLS